MKPIDISPRRLAQQKRYEKTLDIIIVAFIVFLAVYGFYKLIHG